MRWATAEEGNWSLRQGAADRNDPQVWLKLDKQRQRQSRWRWSLLGLGLFLTAIAALILIGDRCPAGVRLGAAARGRCRCSPGSGVRRTGRSPTGCPRSKRYRKLTADLVRRA